MVPGICQSIESLRIATGLEGSGSSAILGWRKVGNSMKGGDQHHRSDASLTKR